MFRQGRKIIMFDVILPLLILLALGAGLSYKKILHTEHMQALADYVLKVALPIFLFYVLATRKIHEVWQPVFLFWFSFISLIIFAITFLICHYYLKLEKKDSSIFALGSSMSNTGFIGVGVLPLILGQQAGIYISLALIVESVIIFPLALILTELFNNKVALKQILLQIARIMIKNPIIIAIILGILCSSLNLSFFSALDKSLKLIGQTASPIALLVIGARLLHIKISDFNRLSLLLSILKVVIMPFLMLLTFTFIPNSTREMTIAGFILATLPMTITYTLFAQSHHIGEKAVTSLLSSMLLWIILSSFYLYLLQYIQ